MNKTIRFACVLLMINIITILSCSKSDRTNSDPEIAKSTELTIDEAKSWFSQKHAEDITTLSLLTKSNGEQRFTSYVPGAFAGNPDWNAYRHYQTNLGLLVALDNTSGKYGYRSFRDIIITKDSLGKLKDYVQEVKFDSAYFANLVKTKGTDPNIRAYMEPATFTGKVLLYTTSNLFIRGSIYENGVLVSEIKPKEGVIGTVGLGGSLLKSYIAVGGEDDQTLPEVIVVGHYPPPSPPPPPPYFPPPPPPYYPPPPPPPYGGGGGTSSEAPPPLTMTKEDQQNYPRLTEMVKKLLEYVKNNPKVLQALIDYSGLTKEQIQDKLKFGNGPTIQIIDFETNSTYGKFNGIDNPNVLNLNAAFVRGLEGAALQGTIEATSFLLAVTSLHEFVHYGRFFNGLSEGPYDYGLGFERDAYGVTIDKDNAGKYSWQFYKK